MPLGEEVIIDNVKKIVHHMDDQEMWSKDPVFHPSFEPGNKPTEEKWTCSFNHSYSKCKCHLELREYGQDESVYHSGDHPATRWGVDHRSYAISKSKGILKMASMFKDYSMRGTGLHMTEDDLQKINMKRRDKKYMDGT